MVSTSDGVDGTVVGWCDVLGAFEMDGAKDGIGLILGPVLGNGVGSRVGFDVMVGAPDGVFVGLTVGALDCIIVAGEVVADELIGMGAVVFTSSFSACVRLCVRALLVDWTVETVFGFILTLDVCDEQRRGQSMRTI